MVWYRYSSLIAILALSGCAVGGGEQREEVEAASTEDQSVLYSAFYGEAVERREEYEHSASSDLAGAQKRSVSQAEDARNAAEGAAVMMPAVDGDLIAVEPGHCMVYAQIKPRPSKRVIEVTVKDSSTKIHVTPAQLKKGYRQVVTREGVVTYRIEPPQFKKVIERVLVRPEIKSVEVVPAVYQKKTEQVKVKDSRTVFEPCQVAGSKYSKGAGVVGFCAKEIPAEYQTVEVEELVQEETTRTVVVPAEYQEVTRWEVSQPARAVEVMEEAEVQHLLVDNLVHDAIIDEQQTAPQTKALSVTDFEGESRVVVRRAVCDMDMTPELVVAVQEKLLEEGYNPGEIDGLLGRHTIAALADYQLQHRLAIGALTYETLTEMGIE